MKHLRLFKTEAEYNSATLELPNVSYVEDTNVVFYIPKSEEPEEPVVAPIGASIYGLDGKFYSASEWTAAGKNNSDAVGVAYSDGIHSYVMHPDVGEYIWSSDTETVIEGVTIVNSDSNDYEAPLFDFAGESNTAAILAAVQAGTITDAPAAQYAASVVFADGRKGYLPAAGELNVITKSGDTNLFEKINTCYKAIGKEKMPFNPENDYYDIRMWTSTLNNSSGDIYAWGYSTSGDWCMLGYDRDRSRTVLVFSSL